MQCCHGNGALNAAEVFRDLYKKLHICCARNHFGLKLIIDLLYLPPLTTAQIDVEKRCA